ncbi:MAG: hypothetical protein KGL39_31700 [Patescibacteria group bacterium]|nr:hypothetical protein [Patescibacteria group bacterium]
MQTDTRAPIHEKQLALPVAREERLGLLRALRRAKLAVISPLMRSNICDLLECVEMNSGADGCRLSKELLKEKLRINERTVIRWQQVAEELGVLQKAPRWLDGGKGRQAENLQRIDWHCVRRLVRESLPPIGETLFVHDWADDGEMASIHIEADSQTFPQPVDSDVRGLQNSVTPGEAIVTPGVAFSCDSHPAPVAEALSPATGDTMGDKTGVTNFEFVTPMVNGTNDSPERRTIEPISLPRKDPISCHSAHSCHSGVTAPKTVTPHAGERFPVDRCPLSLDLLRSPQGIDRWFQFALSRRWLRDIDRLRVFTVARCLMRRVDANPREFTNPCGAFVRSVKLRKWFGSEDDQAWATKMIRWLDEVQ